MFWIQRFARDLLGSYADSVRALAALPWLFAAIIGWEFAQHVVEVRLGMFESREIARAMNDDGLRMVFGWIKMASIYVGAFFVIRHFAGSREDRALAPLGTAARRFLPYVLYALAVFGALFYAADLVPASQVDTLRATLGLVQLLIEPLTMHEEFGTALLGRLDRGTEFGYPLLQLVAPLFPPGDLPRRRHEPSSNVGVRPAMGQLIRVGVDRLQCQQELRHRQRGVRRSLAGCGGVVGVGHRRPVCQVSGRDRARRSLATTAAARSDRARRAESSCRRG